MKTLRTFLASKHGKLAEHYAIVFLGAAAATLAASSQHLAGVHGVHALAATLVGLGAAAVKAGYDAVRQLAVPALLAWSASRGVKAAVSAPAPVSAAPVAVPASDPTSAPAAPKKPAAKKPPAK